LYDNPTEEMEEIQEDRLWEEAWWRAETLGEISRIDWAFEKYVLIIAGG